MKQSTVSKNGQPVRHISEDRMFRSSVPVCSSPEWTTLKGLMSFDLWVFSSSELKIHPEIQFWLHGHEMKAGMGPWWWRRLSSSDFYRLLNFVTVSQISAWPCLRRNNKMRCSAVAALCYLFCRIGRMWKPTPPFIKFVNGFFDSQCQEHARSLLINDWRGIHRGQPQQGFSLNGHIFH